MKKDKIVELEGKTQIKGGVNSEPYNLHIVNKFIQYIDELIMSDEELVMNVLSEDYNVGLSTLKIKCIEYKELIKVKENGK